MQARGLGARDCRTVARVQRMSAGDWGWIVAAVGLAASATAISVAVGAWRPLIG
jgi:glycine/D-amino acid oxidase-like deaminating enzyme